ncbi:MAG: 50S ribosomal protein L13 [Calditrichaeota bacterium]|nr:50S ribosomal protein L13 [Calditrichota bacterium]
MKTYSPKLQDIDAKWYVVDADGMVLGRLASKIAQVLRGKHKPIWAPYIDTGDFVVVINADKIRVTGRKAEQKKYYRHSGYLGGLKVTPYKRMMENKPEFILHEAVRGMLPHNRLGRQMLKKLKVYTSSDHPHTAQKPEAFPF